MNQKDMYDRMQASNDRTLEDMDMRPVDAAVQADEDWRAIEAGLASVDRGEEGVDLDEAIDRLRRKYGIHHQP